jgi:hypothetical protein
MSVTPAVVHDTVHRLTAASGPSRRSCRESKPMLYR